MSEWAGPSLRSDTKVGLEEKRKSQMPLKEELLLRLTRSRRKLVRDMMGNLRTANNTAIEAMKCELLKIRISNQTNGYLMFPTAT